MFGLKKKIDAEAVADVAGQVAARAEELYRSGKMHCAEAVLAAVKEHFIPDAPDSVLQLAAGFGGGSGSGCLCGAVSGGSMAFGLAANGDRKGATAQTKELHRWFTEEFGTTCCRTLTANGKGGCLKLTVRVAAKVAEQLAEQGA